MTTDNSRHQTFTGNVTNGNVNFGDNSVLTNTISQLSPLCFTYLRVKSKKDKK